MLIEFYGSSDDNMCWRINGGRRNGGADDEVGCYRSGNELHHCTMLVSTIGGALGVRIHAIYDGCWSFAIGQLEDGRSLPSGWSFAVGQEHPYSTRLSVNTGDEPVTVTRVEKP